MANISHWHNRSRPKEEMFLELIEKQNWDEAEFEAKTDPLIALNVYTVQSFLGKHDRKSCQITSMHYAVAYGAPLDFIDFLHKANPKSLLTRDSQYKRLPIHAAFIGDKYKKHPNVLLKLIEYDPHSAKGKDVLGRYPLHYSCHHHVHPQVIDALIEAYPQAAKHADIHGWLPIHVACRSNMSIEVVKKLLELYPESIHKKTDKGSTSLDCAKKAKTDNEELIKLLTEATESTPEAQESNESSPSDSDNEYIRFFDCVNSNTKHHLIGTVEGRISPPPEGDQAAKPDLTNLSFTPVSPYSNDKKSKIPFLQGVQMITLDG